MAAYFICTLFISFPIVISGQRDTNVLKMNDIADLTSTKIWKFAVSADTRVDETVGVTGDGDTLGNWHANSVYLLRNRTTLDSRNGGDTVWYGEVLLPDDIDIKYRYCICSLNKEIVDNGSKLSSAVSVRYVETHIAPRTIKKQSGSNVKHPIQHGDVEVFGFDTNNSISIGDGPLVTDSVVQFILSNNSFLSRYPYSSNNHQTYIKLYSFPLGMDYKSCLLLDDWRKSNELCAPYSSNVLISVLNGKESRFRKQDIDGHLFSNEDFIVFQTRTFSVPNSVFVFGFRINRVEDGSSNTIRSTGYGHIWLNFLQSTSNVAVSVVDNTYDFLAQLTVKYLLIHPTVEIAYDLDLQKSYSKFWKETWNGLEIGHRGSGVSFSTCDANVDIRENTIGSLKAASENGADMVEFDVQLSKDSVPVVYHDFHVLLSALHDKNPGQITKLKFPFHELSSNDLHSLKIFNLKEENCSKLFLNEGSKDYDPFPTLEEVLKTINPFIGFNIEIKYTLEQTNGINELDYPPDMNDYLDKILSTVFTNAGNRFIIFSSFNPDICTMLRLKQNRYAVLFLTQGVTQKYTGYKDLRTISIPMAVNFALSSGILGINVHTEDLLRDQSQVKYVLDNDLILFCWGNDNNNRTIIQHLKDNGVHGIIFDRFSDFTTKESRKSIFEEEKFTLPYGNSSVEKKYVVAAKQQQNF